MQPIARLDVGGAQARLPTRCRARPIALPPGRWRGGRQRRPDQRERRPAPVGPAEIVAISDGSTSDWSTKDRRGREHRLSIAIWDDGDSPARLHDLLGQAQDAIEAMPRSLPGQGIASLVFLRARVVRDPDGPWAGRLDYRVRTLED